MSQSNKNNPTSIPAPRAARRSRKIFLVHVRICDRLVKDMDRIVIREQTTRSDFLREAIEEKLRREGIEPLSFYPARKQWPGEVLASEKTNEDFRKECEEVA